MGLYYRAIDTCIDELKILGDLAVVVASIASQIWASVLLYRLYLNSYKLVCITNSLKYNKEYQVLNLI